MNVLVSLNRGYLRFFCVMLSSLLSSTERRMEVYVLHDDLEEEDFSRIRALFPEAGFHFKKMDGALCEGFPTVRRYPRTIYYRIFAPTILPESVDRILYLDCDLVVHGNIDGLYDADLGTNLFAACSHTLAFMNAFNMLRLGGGPNRTYMNTGVLLMNVKELRKVMDPEAIREYTVKNRRRLMLYDQDVLYRFFGDRVTKEDTFVYNLADRQMRFRLFYGRPHADALWVEKNNAIVHYIGRNKPWKKTYNGALGRYWYDAEREFSEREKSGARPASPARDGGAENDKNPAYLT